MTSSGFPGDAETRYVVDASVVMNLNATRCADRIIQALPGAFIVTPEVIEDLERGVAKGHADADDLELLIEIGLVSIARRGDAATEIFRSLIDGPAIETLDDGEAATIAYACEVAAVALIDDRKAINICARRFSELPVVTTVDILLSDMILNALGERGRIDAVVDALQKARMRVPRDRVDAIAELIGEETAAKCGSLPKWVR